MDDPFGPPGQEPMDVEQQQQPQQLRPPPYRLLTAPPIPWPQPTLAAESVLQLGGRYWPAPKPPSAVATAAVVLELADELDRVQHAAAAAAARDDYLQALYLPEAVYGVADLVHALGRHGDLLPSSLVVPVAVVTAKHRRVMPYMLPTLTSGRPPDVVHEPGSPIDETEWRALRAGFGVRLGAKGLGISAKAAEGESEEARNERRRAEDDRWVEAGKAWLEGLERREWVQQRVARLLERPP
jgi:hypothetical protein